MMETTKILKKVWKEDFDNKKSLEEFEKLGHVFVL